jgi:hypothetical protein
VVTPLVLMGVFACVQAPWLYQHLVLGGAGSMYGQPSLTLRGGMTLSIWRVPGQPPRDDLARVPVLPPADPPRLRDRATLLASIVLLGLAGWAGSIYITRIDVNELAQGSGDRLLMTLIPIASFYCAVHPLMRERLLGRSAASRAQ